MKQPSCLPQRRKSKSANIELESAHALLRVLLDEGVPVSVGDVFRKAGYQTIDHRDVLSPGAVDDVVAKAAIRNEAVLIACDNDMKRLNSRYGRSDHRFEKLSLIKLACPEPLAAGRLEQAMSLIELEWKFCCQKVARRLFIEIGPHHIRTNR